MLGIVITIIGLAAIVIFSKHTYSSAKDTGRNAGVLIFLNIGLGLAFQWFLPFFATLGVVLIMLIRGSGSDGVELPAGFLLQFSFSIIGLALSVFAMMKVLAYASSYPDDPITGTNAPPPPPTFGEGQ